ncbi:MAG: endonuclease MutS2, partial [Anaerolineales bacterium]|nr:endonuclease MutS2 [Anaerolineales bacterium]
MDEKTLRTLEYDKILQRLADYTAFSASREKVLERRPSIHLADARVALTEVTEARLLLDTHDDVSIGGARDVRENADAATRGIVLTPTDLLDVKFTLVSARKLARLFEREEQQFPALADIALDLPTDTGLVDAISRAISDRGEIMDSASDRLGSIRREISISHDRLLTKMERMLNNKSIAPHLQEAIITQRDGRYVLPIRADAKGRVKAVVHDQSSSGATLFVEPLPVVELNNQWRELQLEERDEERRIMTALSARIGAQVSEIVAAVETLAELDVAFARAKYAEDLNASEPVLRDFEPKGAGKHPGVTLRLWQARHPLLDQSTVVPLDVELDPETYVLVITGPNTGGKTVTLKTVGLLALMAQAGLHIPALAGSEISVFHSVHADIGDEQSIEQSLSTFSGHIRNIVRILEEADTHSLVVIDELGAGTDPQEGAALAGAILGHLVERGVTTLVATHYPELKTYAHATPGVVNASVEFDLETLRPTYHLTIGLPGRSNALAIAQRLGLQLDIVEGARQTIDPAELKAEDLLNEIHRQRDLARTARAEAEKAQQEAETRLAEIAERLENIEDERLNILDQARRAAREEMDELGEEVRKARRQLALARQPLEVIEQVSEQVEALEEEVQEPVERKPVKETAPNRPLKLGDKVRVRTLDQEGVVTTLGEEEAEVQIGMLRVRARLTDLQLKSGEPVVKPVAEVAQTTTSGYAHASPGVELSLRGMRVDEALDATDRHLEAAYMARLPYVRIVHGKGTGRLREAVRAML